MVEDQQHGEQLKRGLKNYHIQLIALGGTIGIGLSLGSASVIQFARPEIVLGYATAGFIAFLVMRQLGEMVVKEPITGPFSHPVYKYRGSFTGFTSDWNYWVPYVLVAVAELTAAGKHIQFWYPGVPTWVSAIVFFVMISAINLTSVRVSSEMEFWFAIIKVIAVVTMITFDGWLLFNGSGGLQATVSDLWGRGGLLSHGFTGLMMMMVIIMSSLDGLELVGITVAEADNPEQGILRVINQAIYRILIFHIGSLAVLLSLMPQTRVTTDTSPFVLILHELGNTFMANALNIVIPTAALSIYNSRVYCNSHMLFGLAQQGGVPKALASVDKRDSSVDTVLVSVLITMLCVLISYLAPESAFGLLMALAVSALVINWVMISLVHMKFCHVKQEQGVVTHFPVLLCPLGNWICPLFMVAMLVIMLMTLGMAIPVYLIPLWLIVLDIGYLFREETVKTVRAH